MSTAALNIQPLASNRRDTDLNFDTMSKATPIYSTSEQWNSSSQEDLHYLSMPEYTGFPIASTQLSAPFAPHPNLESHNPTNHNFDDGPVSNSALYSYTTRSHLDTPLHLNTTGMYNSPVMFSTSNAQAEPHQQATISPMDTRFDVDHSSPESGTKPSFEPSINNDPPSFHPTYNDHDAQQSSKGRCDSLQSNSESQTSAMPQVGRRRGSEYAEPGSARAIYLEKNRKAASKCRGKQKREQEELVEKARHVERRNKILKAEVEILKSDMRDLMELVGQHADCPDARLKLYVQREADRLVSWGTSSSSPVSGGSSSGPPSTEKGLTPEGG